MLYILQTNTHTHTPPPPHTHTHTHTHSNTWLIWEIMMTLYMTVILSLTSWLSLSIYGCISQKHISHKSVIFHPKTWIIIVILHEYLNFLFLHKEPLKYYGLWHYFNDNKIVCFYKNHFLFMEFKSENVFMVIYFYLNTFSSLSFILLYFFTEFCREFLKFFIRMIFIGFSLNTVICFQ